MCRVFSSSNLHELGTTHLIQYSPHILTICTSTTNTTNTIPSSYTIKLYLFYEVLVRVLWMRFCDCLLSSQKYATELLLDLQVVVGEWQVINSFFFQDKDFVWRETIIVRYNYGPMISGAQWKSRLPCDTHMHVYMDTTFSSLASSSCSQSRCFKMANSYTLIHMHGSSTVLWLHQP